MPSTRSGSWRDCRSAWPRHRSSRATAVIHGWGRRSCSASASPVARRTWSGCWRRPGRRGRWPRRSRTTPPRRWPGRSIITSTWRPARNARWRRRRPTAPSSWPLRCSRRSWRRTPRRNAPWRRCPTRWSGHSTRSGSPSAWRPSAPRWTTASCWAAASTSRALSSGPWSWRSWRMSAPRPTHRPISSMARWPACRRVASSSPWTRQDRWRPIWPRSSRDCAPSARRIPISFVRWTTE